VTRRLHELRARLEGEATRVDHGRRVARGYGGGAAGAGGAARYVDRSG
jgi:hypothetical protein